MTKALPDRFFVTGTDTGIGKTLVSAMLCLGLDSAYWKPVQSGFDEGSDSEWIHHITGIDKKKIFPETYKLKMPLSPHQAAAIDGVTIEMDKFKMPDCRQLVVEGAGGIMVPLNQHYMVIDLIKQLNLPTLVVARSGLGTINHSVLTVKTLQAHQIEVLGVVLNGEHNEPNKQAIEHYAQVPVIAQIPLLEKIDRNSLMSTFHKSFTGSRTNESIV